MIEPKIAQTLPFMQALAFHPLPKLWTVCKFPGKLGSGPSRLRCKREKDDPWNENCSHLGNTVLPFRQECVCIFSSFTKDWTQNSGPSHLSSNKDVKMWNRGTVNGRNLHRRGQRYRCSLTSCFTKPLHFLGHETLYYNLIVLSNDTGELN